MRQHAKSPSRGELALTAGLAATIFGIVLYCAGEALGAHGGLAILTPETGAGIMATGILIWLKGAATLSLEL